VWITIQMLRWMIGRRNNHVLLRLGWSTKWDLKLWWDRRAKHTPQRIARPHPHAPSHTFSKIYTCNTILLMRKVEMRNGEDRATKKANHIETGVIKRCQSLRKDKNRFERMNLNSQIILESNRLCGWVCKWIASNECII